MTGRMMLSLTLLTAMSAWGVWLLDNAKNPGDYAIARAAVAPTTARCEWVPMTTPGVASIGFSDDVGHSWSDRATAYLALHTGSMPDDAWIDVDVTTVAKGRVLVEVAGNEETFGVTGGGMIRVPIPTGRTTQLLTFVSEDMLPPHGQDRRWLGIAISRVRVCAESYVKDRGAR